MSSGISLRYNCIAELANVARSFVFQPVLVEQTCDWQV
jgi:hypothetical protein